MTASEWQLGRTKVFIRSPESLFLLEEQRDRKYEKYARVIQRGYRSYKAQKLYLDMKKASYEVLHGQKERRRQTLNRGYVGDYIGFRDDPILRSLSGQETIVYADSVTKYDRDFKPTDWEIMLGRNSIYLVGYEKAKEGPFKGKTIKALKRQISLKEVDYVSTR